MRQQLILLTVIAAVGSPSGDFARADERTKIDAAGLRKFLAAEDRVENFRHAERVFPVKRVRRGTRVFQFRESPRLRDAPYRFAGRQQNIFQFLKQTSTTGLLVVKDDEIVFERYDLGNTKNSRNTSMSVVKSFVSALVGIAIDEGHIQSVNAPVTRYLPELKGTAYDGVSIKHVLQMSSGVRFTEEYDDPDCDFYQLFCDLGRGEKLNQYLSRLKRKRPAGEAFYYASIDTQVLAAVVEKSTGRSISEYLEEKIWRPLGMESDATWCTDNYGNQIGFVLLNATLRDYAKFGRLYLNGGSWQGRQIVSKRWVEESTRPGRDDLRLKDFYGPGWDIGYQYQWWVPAGTDGEFTAIGIWGQYLYANPRHHVVIVKTSVDPGFDERDRETIAVFRAIVRQLSEQ